MAQDKIKRAITWIRRSLEITERTTNPGTIQGEIVPTVDIFGWDRLREIETFSQATAAVTTVQGPVTPADVLRYVLHFGVEHSEALGTSLTLWVDLLTELSFPVPLIAPQLIPGAIAGETIRYGGGRPIILRPGDRLRGRASPATGPGINLSVRAAFIDLPIGEYIPPL